MANVNYTGVSNVQGFTKTNAHYVGMYLWNVGSSLQKSVSAVPQYSTISTGFKVTTNLSTEMKFNFA